MLSNELGEYIKRIRTKRNMTLGQLGEIISYSDAYISMVENGKKIKPSYEFLSKLAKGLNADYHYLMYSAGYINKEEYDEYRLTSEQEEIDNTIKRIYRLIEEESDGDLEEIESRKLKFDKIIEGTDDTYTKKLRDLNYFLDTNPDLTYKEHELTESDKQDIKTFIEHFIIKK